ncbi:pilus assembly protein TadG-related protein [Xanthobacteraceae bacterium Astr-EGSB]|uniref:TadE/TadG family type IV pilus assembly protein n=1 Tax=Astrobacterium formosum TaxID=3069710 RepID=UPI0027B42D97|nr:pilus assembly protein TadG-related protein [Xanthobacteraceae bacterium Astr-EGSB]
MSFRITPASLMRNWRRLFAENGGNVTITFAVALVPLLALVGTAVDYSRASAIRTAMQSAADSTALAMSKTAASLTKEEIKKQAEAMFKGLLSRTDVGNLVITAAYSSEGGSTVTVTATGTMKTSFLGVLGISEMQLGTNAVTTWGNSRLRVALVLDNTGSMDQSNKLSKLKNATKDLLTTLQSAATTSADVYVSIIPFAKNIKVDTNSYDEDWIYWGTPAQDPTLSDDDSWDANNGTCSTRYATTRSQCFANSCSISGYTNQNACTNAYMCSNPLQKTKSACTGEKACSKSYSSKSACENHWGTWGYGTWKRGVWDTSITWTPTAHKNWKGCITDRGDANGPNAGNYDTNTVTPTPSNKATLFIPAHPSDYCPVTVKPLNNDWATMSTFVDEMTAKDSTNQGIGLVHGWQSLVGGGPYPTPPTMDTNYTYKQVIILMSDGLNTKNRWWGDGFRTGTAEDAKIDARERLTCTNAKAADITIYTIQVNTSTDPTSQVLQDCASPNTEDDPGPHFYLVTSASGINDTFQQIGSQLSKLRISK